MIDENEFVIFGWMGWDEYSRNTATLDLDNIPGRIAIRRKSIVEIVAFSSPVTAIRYQALPDEKIIYIDTTFDAVMQYLTKGDKQ